MKCCARFPCVRAVATTPAQPLPAGALAGWALHPLESAAFSRRTPISDVRRSRFTATKQAIAAGGSSPDQTKTHTTPDWFVYGVAAKRRAS